MLQQDYRSLPELGQDGGCAEACSRSARQTVGWATRRVPASAPIVRTSAAPMALPVVNLLGNPGESFSGLDGEAFDRLRAWRCDWEPCASRGQAASVARERWTGLSSARAAQDESTAVWAEPLDGDSPQGTVSSRLSETEPCTGPPSRRWPQFCCPLLAPRQPSTCLPMAGLPPSSKHGTRSAESLSLPAQDTEHDSRFGVSGGLSVSRRADGRRSWPRTV